MTLGSAHPITDPDRIRAAQSWGALTRHFNEIEGASANRPNKPYRQVPVVRRAVSTKAKMLASMPMRLSTSDDRIIESGPLIDLIECPNPLMGRVDFWKSTSTWLDLSGACHWVFTRMQGSRPTEIVPVSSWQMRPVVDRMTGELKKWRYRAVGTSWSDAVDIMPDEVWTVGEDAFDPDKPFGYSSPLEAAGMSISQVFKADLANEASLDNGVEPGGVFTIPGTPTEPQLADARRQIKERAGSRNRRRHLVLYGGMTWESISSSFSEMEFSTLLKLKQTDVCIAIDVDPAAIGLVEGGRYEFVKSAKASLWTDVIIPRGIELSDEFRRGVIDRWSGTRAIRHTKAVKRAVPARTAQRTSPSYAAAREAIATRPAGITAWFDSSRVPAVREMQLDLLKGGAILINDYKQPPADVLDLLDVGVQTHDHQKVGWQKTGEMPIDEPAPGENDPDGSTHDEPLPEEDEGKTAPTTKALSEKALAGIWEKWRASWSGLEKQMRSRVDGHFKALRRETLRRLEEQLGNRSTASVNRDVIDVIVFELVPANERLLKKVGPLVLNSYMLGGQQSMDEAAIAQGKEAKDADPFNIADPETQRALRNRRSKIAGINRTLQRRLKGRLAEGVEAGESVQQLAERIRKEFNFASSRATTIARTEVGGAVEEARQRGRVQARVPAKSWLWSRKETGRENHMLTEQQTLESPVGNEQDFIIAVTNNPAPHPRGSGVAEDDINCGCTTIARYPGDQVKDARLMRHMKTAGFTSAEDLNTRGLTTDDGDHA